MRMQVRELGDEVFIELYGVAGRHQRILQVLTDGHIASAADGVPRGLSATDVNVRAGADEMHIRLRSRAGRPFEALSIYQYLRHVLIEQGGEPDGTGPADAPPVQAEAGAAAHSTA